MVAERKLGTSIAGTGALSIVPAALGIALSTRWTELLLSAEGPHEGSIFTSPIYVAAVVSAFALTIIGMAFSVFTGKGIHTRNSIVKCSDGTVRLRQQSVLFWKQLDDKLSKPCESIAVGYEDPQFSVSLRGHRDNDLVLLVTSKEREYKQFLDELIKFTKFEVTR